MPALRTPSPLSLAQQGAHRAKRVLKASSTLWADFPQIPAILTGDELGWIEPGEAVFAWGAKNWPLMSSLRQELTDLRVYREVAA